MFLLQHADVRLALYAAASTVNGLGYLPPRRRQCRPSCRVSATGGVAAAPRPSPSSDPDAFISYGAVKEKPAVCTADELHYVPVPGTHWRLALWRYIPPPEAPPRNHPLMLLSGVGTNAIGFDLSPGASFARHMSSQGFDTWVVELRGAGLSIRDTVLKAVQPSDKAIKSNLDSVPDENLSCGISLEQKSIVSSRQMPEFGIIVEEENMKPTVDERQLVARLTNVFLFLSERLSGYLNDGQLKDIPSKFLDRLTRLLETRHSSAVANHIRDTSLRLVNIIEEGQRSVSPPFSNLKERILSIIDDFQKQFKLFAIYDWDFDNYLEEDLPSAMEYIKLVSKPKDGKLFAIGHSMGGILLYAMISKCGFNGERYQLAAAVTLGSSVDYTSSNCSLKLLLPLADPAQALKVPVIPLGALLSAAYPLASRPPYVMSWLSPLISSKDMMLPELLEKLVFNNFVTIPAKLILQLATALRDGGLRNRTGTFFYKDHLGKCNVPVLALAGDLDLICPPDAVYETVKLLPQEIVTYKVFGEVDGPHYAHYDIVGGKLAAQEIYPCIIEFLDKHDGLQ